MYEPLTKAIVYAAASDVYAREVKKRGNLAAAREAYYREFNRLFDLIGGPEGWMDLPAK